ncbi:hypothetical protein VTJ04DRAFT_7113 [Mycothermus thermophilus]|uniref:uncharacterized protein n=1 Tax=Humicola insolens TaxID=85995 RepID=UPI0037439122
MDCNMASLLLSSDRQALGSKEAKDSWVALSRFDLAHRILLPHAPTPPTSTLFTPLISSLSSVSGCESFGRGTEPAVRIRLGSVSPHRASSRPFALHSLCCLGILRNPAEQAQDCTILHTTLISPTVRNGLLPSHSRAPDACQSYSPGDRSATSNLACSRRLRQPVLCWFPRTIRHSTIGLRDPTSPHFCGSPDPQGQ